MSVVMEESAIPQTGVNKQEFEATLKHVSDQVRWIDQQLTMRVDNEVWQSFRNQHNEMNDTQALIKKTTTLQPKKMPLSFINDKV